MVLAFPCSWVVVTVGPMSSPDVHWIQRLQKYSKALACLAQAVRLAAERPLTELEQLGLIQGFEYTHELAWNVLKDYLEAQGFVDIIGFKGATRVAFKNGLIQDGEVWMDMIKARNLTSHTYQSEVADDISRNVLDRFFSAFLALEQRMRDLAAQDAETP